MPAELSRLAGRVRNIEEILRHGWDDARDVRTVAAELADAVADYLAYEASPGSEPWFIASDLVHLAVRLRRA